MFSHHMLRRFWGVLAIGLCMSASQPLLAALSAGGSTASSGDYAGSPPLAVQGADPFLMIDLSVELTQQAEAFTDGAQTYSGGTVCPGRLTSQATPWGTINYVGVCYTSTEKYIGYFDSEKCYAYDTSGTNTNVDQLATGPRSNADPHYFKPNGLANGHQCTGAFSGNFLNWATMSALDQFRSAMTGGARLLDTYGASGKTLLIRTRRMESRSPWPFVMKAIKNGGGLTVSSGGVSRTFTNDPSKVTPFNLGATSASTVTGTIGPLTTGTTACPKKSGAGSGSYVICTTVDDAATSATDAIYVVNDWTQISPAPVPSVSNHSVRFYTFPSATTTTKKTAVTYRSNNTVYDTTVVSSSTTGPATVAKELTPGNGATNGFNVIVGVCDNSALAGGVESNCIKYSSGSDTWYKPEGLLQKNALKMKYALTSYTARSGNPINGGVLRANAKYIGNQMPTSTGGIQDNPNKEVDGNGVFVFDPDKLAAKTGGVNGVSPVNSGVINYINQFALFATQYKSNDPDAELYYEGLRYLMKLGPTDSFMNPPGANGGALNAQEQDGYPIFGAGTAASPSWSDPIANSCQKNYALYVGDKNSHNNNYLPGGTTVGSDSQLCTGECSVALGKGINVTSLQNDIGTVEGHTASYNYGNNHGNGLAAMAWWGRTHDFRTGAQDVPGDQRLKTFIVDTQEFGAGTPVGNSNTLWMAAKWGGFEDSNNNSFGTAAVPSPDLLSEWNAKGAVFSDGTRLPDTYTLASQPSNLVAGLTSAFDEVLSKTSSAAAAAVVANSTVGTAAIYQALYRPRISNNTTAVTWTGLVRSFFIDDKGRIREDTNGNAQLDNADNVVVFRQDLVSQIAVADRYSVGGSLIASGVAVDSLIPIWNASDRLAALTDTQATTQRTYANSAAGGRYIFTWIDSNNNGVVDAGEVQSFSPSNFPALTAATNDSIFDPARLLGVNSTNGQAGALYDPNKLINYIRGADQNGYRNRTIDLGSGSKTLRLGDVVHSAPLVVSAPAQNYDSVYLDDSYSAFKLQYKDRRQVLYVGSNDGMLHAFNGGFFNGASNGYYTTSNGGTGTETAHSLGSELWAYVPYNLLPHLQWLTDSAYQHSYYVDGAPQSFDVNIFPVDADHPYGWGTILVVGFRLGGGDITVNATTDQVGLSDPGNRTMRSAYVMLDITNPESPPKLLAELSDPSLGFTVSKPAVVKKRVAISGSFKTSTDSAHNQWYLVMGSGPAGTDAANKQLALTNAVSNQPARMFIYNLNQSQWVDANNSTTILDAFLIGGQANSFVGDLAVKDWNADYMDDVVYFGTVGTAPLPNQDPIGDLMRMQMPAGFSLGTPTFSTLLTGNTNTPSNGQPFSMAPLPVIDNSGQPWVYAGSGRFYVSSDILSQKQMSYYGIREPLAAGSPTYASVGKTSLTNTTGIQVYTDGTVKNSAGNPLSISGSPVNNYSELIQAVANTSGWYFNFTGLSERDVDISQLFFDNLLITGYTTSNNSCSPLGSSRRIAASLLTGTATPTAVLGSDATTHLVTYSKDLGIGQFFSSGVIQVGTGNNAIYLDPTTGSTGEEHVEQLHHSPIAYGRRTSWRELPLQ